MWSRGGWRLLGRGWKAEITSVVMTVPKEEEQQQK
jgi:hypothetical protein